MTGQHKQSRLATVTLHRKKIAIPCSKCTVFAGCAYMKLRLCLGTKERFGTVGAPEVPQLLRWDIWKTGGYWQKQNIYEYIQYINPRGGKFPSIAFCWALLKDFFHASSNISSKFQPLPTHLFFQTKVVTSTTSDLKNNKKLKIPPKVMARLKISRNPLLNAPIFVMSGNNPIADILDHQIHYQPILQIQLIHL